MQSLQKVRAAFQAAERTVAKNIGKLEVLKPRISQRYERYQQIMLERASRNAVDQGVLHKENPDIAKVSKDSLFYQGSLDNARPLSPGKNRQIAVKLAHGEERRRKRLRTDPPRLEASNRRKYQPSDGDDLRVLMEDTRRKIGGNGFSTQYSAIQTSSNQNGSSQDLYPSTDGIIPYNYPSVPRKSSDRRPREDPDVKSSQPLDEDSFTAPARPPKEYFQDQLSPPQPPPKSALDDLRLPPHQNHLTSSLDSGGDAVSEPDPSNYNFKATATLENGTALRTVFLPIGLRSVFLTYALNNTTANLETCGILCGTLISNALFISKLVIPEQESTSDTCETVNESELFDYCDREDLMVLGWIHTHPTQTCFMSSRDLHTHCGYQVMMPESIAIVCAPSRNPS